MGHCRVPPRELPFCFTHPCILHMSIGTYRVRKPCFPPLGYKLTTRLSRLSGIGSVLSPNSHPAKEATQVLESMGECVFKAYVPRTRLCLLYCVILTSHVAGAFATFLVFGTQSVSNFAVLAFCTVCLSLTFVPRTYYKHGSSGKGGPSRISRRGHGTHGSRSILNPYDHRVGCVPRQSRGLYLRTGR
jgi:hypothetical protein